MRGIRRKPVDRHHFPAGNIRHLRLARKRALAVDMHHAGTAEADAAAKLGAGEFEFFPDHSSGVSSGALYVLSSPLIFSVAKPPAVWRHALTWRRHSRESDDLPNAP
jgi:hypothetical protein